MKYFLFLISVLLPLSTQAAVGGKAKMACFSDYHKCMRKNKGGMKMCLERRKSCMAGDFTPNAAGSKRIKKAKSKFSCQNKYTKCLRKKRGIDVCHKERLKCRDAMRTAPVGERVDPKPAKTEKAAKTPVTKRTPPADGTCWTMSLALEGCKKRDAKTCSKVSNVFYDQGDCDRCYDEFRGPIKKYDMVFYRNARKFETCREHRKDTEAMGKCIKKMRAGKEKMHAQKYWEAQRDIDELVLRAKESGIEGCGNFSRYY